MQKFWLIILSITQIFNASATQFYEGKQYFTLKKPINENFKILDFFSFYCLHCYQFKEIFHIDKEINKRLPKGIKIINYHVKFLGPLGKDLTQAWAVAKVLNLEDKILTPMFQAVQKTHTIKSTSDIRQIFLNIGVKSKDYDDVWNSFIVRSLVLKQEKLANDLQLKGVPAFFVKGKYQINLQAIDNSSIDLFISQFTDIIKYLLER